MVFVSPAYILVNSTLSHLIKYSSTCFAHMVQSLNLIVRKSMWDLYHISTSSSILNGSFNNRTISVLNCLHGLDSFYTHKKSENC